MFKEILDKARQNYIPAWRLVIATEVDSYLENNAIKVNDETFEVICCFVYEWVNSTEALPYEVIDNLVKLIQNSDYYKFDGENINYYWDEITKDLNQMF